MLSSDFEKELKSLDQRFSVVDNPNRQGLSNIFFNGMNYDLPVISTFDIRDEIDPTHVYTFENGARARFWAKPEILARITDFLGKMNTGDFARYHDEEPDKG